MDVVLLSILFGLLFLVLGLALLFYVIRGAVLSALDMHERRQATTPSASSGSREP